MNDSAQLFNTETDAFQDLKNAQTLSARTGKNILVEVGADWCVWCHRLESFINTHAELYVLRSTNFVHVRVHSGDGVELSEICTHLPPFNGIPHYFVLDSNGDVLHSQDTELLEDGESYNYDKVWEFLSLWGYTGDRNVLQ